MNTATRIDVLLADDDADDRALTLRALRGLPFGPNVAEVEDGEAAIDYLCQQGRFGKLAGSPPPRLVLLDLKLPLRNGIEVLASLRADRRLVALPVVVLTSSEHDRDIEAAYAAGANGYVLKPGVYANYVPWIQRTVEYWLRINRTPDPAYG